MIRILLCGATGRMGTAVQTLVQQDPAFSVVYAIAPSLGTSFSRCAESADVVIDFSTPAALPEELAFCKAQKLPLLLASTGHTQSAISQIEEASECIPILKSENLSLGAYLLGQLAGAAVSALEGYDACIVETHHRAKADAPSGTAKRLAAQMNTPDIAMHSIRGGGAVGTHEVQFLGMRDSFTLTHETFDRSLFAEGALKASAWLIHCAPGLYAMHDFWNRKRS